MKWVSEIIPGRDTMTATQAFTGEKGHAQFSSVLVWLDHRVRRNYKGLVEGSNGNALREVRRNHIKKDLVCYVREFGLCFENNEKSLKIFK